MANGRCRMHGGTSTGAPKGNRNAWKHGAYSARTISALKLVGAMVERRKESKKIRRGIRRLEKVGIFRDQLLQTAKLYRTNGMQPPSNYTRHPIFLPKDFSLWSNYDETVSVLSEIKQKGMVERIPIVLHFEKVEKIEPSAALVLVSEIYRCSNLRLRQEINPVTGT